MKTLLFLLTIAISSLASASVTAGAASYTTGVAQPDSVPPINHGVVKKQKPEATAVLSLVAGILAFGSLSLVLILSPWVCYWALSHWYELEEVRANGRDWERLW